MVCAIVALVAVSCHKSDSSPEPSPKPGPDPEPGPEIVYVPLANGAGAQYGDYYSSGTEDYYFQLFNGEIDEYGYFKGECTSVSFDCFSVLSAIKDRTTPPASGEYAAADTYAENTFLIGNDVTWREFLQGEADWLTEFFEEKYTIEDLMPEYGITADMLDDLTWDGNAGSSYFHRDAQGNETERAIRNGKITVENSGNHYVFKIDFKIDEEEFHFSYEGDIELEDRREGPPMPVGMIDFEGEYAVAQNWGESWEGAAEPHTTWVLMVYNDTTGEFCELDLIDIPDATTIKTGTYDIVAPVASNIRPGIAVGYYEEYGWSFGCWYGKDNVVLYEGNEGKMTVYVNDGKATMNGTITETATGQQVRITMTDGPISFEQIGALSVKSPSRERNLTNKHYDREKNHSFCQRSAGSNRRSGSM